MNEQEKDVFSTSDFQKELTQKYYAANFESSCWYILKMFRDCCIPNITYDDCEDMYNEYFAIAVRYYQPDKGKFEAFLKRVIQYKTISFIRWVIGSHDPLFFAHSMDKRLENGTSIHEALGGDDYFIDHIDSAFASPEYRKYNLTPLDRAILYYLGYGYKVKEIAKILHISVSNVRRRIVAQRKNKKLLQGLNKLD